MTKLLKFLQENKLFFILLGIYVLLRLIFLNVNYTEWGDTFRMVRASDFLSHLTWPWDEKRWPFYSILLVPGIYLNNPILWGRLLAVIISVFTFLFIYLIYLNFVSQNKKYAIIACVLTAVTSVFAYWSIRVMADPFFTLLVVAYLFLFLKYFSNKNLSFLQKTLMSILLLIATMTRLEGVFLVTATGLFLLLNKRIKDIIYVALPQLIIYLPWTIYAKFLYSGAVQNDYLTEASRFVFTFDRFIYFFSYTIFILTIPISIYFIYGGVKQLLNNKSNKIKYLVPLLFIVQEIFLGAIWTPSLPRIYTPIVPFLVIVMVYGLEKTKKLGYKFIFSSFILTGLFFILQYQQRLYFLGVSKLPFAITVLFSFFVIFLVIAFPFYKKRILIIYFLLIGLLISFTTIYNQKDIYKTVRQGTEYLENKTGKVAYADETGVTEWYLRNNSYYLVSNKSYSYNEMLNLFKKNNVKYVLETTEFNRGSKFDDITDNNDYTLVATFKQPIRDIFDQFLDNISIVSDKDYTVFVTQIYKLNY